MNNSMSAISLKRKARTVPTFLKKTYELLNKQSHLGAVRWSDDGIGFIVTDEHLFAQIVLPKYFKHSKYASFVRQLNMYNFHKVRSVNSESYFHHQSFDRFQSDKLAEIKRKPQRKKRKGYRHDDMDSSVGGNDLEENDSKSIECELETPALTVRRQANRSLQMARNSCHNSISITLIEASDKKLELQKPTHEALETEKSMAVSSKTVQLNDYASEQMVSMEIEDEKSILQEPKQSQSRNIVTRLFFYSSFTNLQGIVYTNCPIEQFTIFH